MNITPQLLMQFAPLLMQAIKNKGGIQNVPNIANALQNGYDTGIMNDLYKNLYDRRALDYVDRYTSIDALNDLNNFYGPRTPIPYESASDAAQVFQAGFDDKALDIANQEINNSTNQDWLNNSSDDELLDMLWKRNNGEPMYIGSNKYVYSKK